MDSIQNYGTNVSFQARSTWLTGINKEQQLSELSEKIKFVEKEIKKTRTELRKPNYDSLPEISVPCYYIEGMEKRLAELRAQYKKLQ